MFARLARLRCSLLGHVWVSLPGNADYLACRSCHTIHQRSYT